MKDEVDNLDIDKMSNFWTISNDSNTKVDDLDVGKLKTVPADLKKIKWRRREWSCWKYKIQYIKDKTK